MSAGLTVRSGDEILVVIPAGQSCVIGRTDDGDPLLADDRVSRRHLLIEPTAKGWAAVDISIFGTWQNGGRVGRILVHGESDLRLGSPDGPVLTLVPHPPADPVAHPATHPPASAVSGTSVDGPAGQHPQVSDATEWPQADGWGQQASGWGQQASGWGRQPEHWDQYGNADWDWSQPTEPEPTPTTSWAPHVTSPHVISPHVTSPQVDSWDRQPDSARLEPWDTAPAPAVIPSARREDEQGGASAAAGGAIPPKVKQHHERQTLLPRKARSGSGPRMPPAEGEPADTGAGLGRLHRLQPGRTVIGRGLSSDIVVGDLLVSREHAALCVDADGVEIVDLDSANGTFVNGHRVERARLRTGDFFSVGHHVFHTGVAAAQRDAAPVRLVEYLDRGDVTFQVDGLCVDVGETRLLHDVTFRLPGRALLGVIGPSGAGKSTLLGALTGFRPATIGSVRYSGRDLYAEYDELRHRIGYVPQDDILHTSLTVRQALEYGAQLRFPAETTREERARRIDEVLVELGLTHRADEGSAGRSGRDAGAAAGRRGPDGADSSDESGDLVALGADDPDGDDPDGEESDGAGGFDVAAPSGVDLPGLKVSKLSGGQRKRTSVALELLTQPTLLYLDEPTSGLDPGLDKEVMGSLRRLADGGRTVVVVTHSVANLDVCDYLLVLAKGGHVAYFGPPQHALEFFGRDSWSDAFQLLKNPATAARLAHRYRNSRYFIRGTASVPKPRPAPLENIRQQSVVSQALTLSRRYLRVIASDPSYLRLLVAYPIVLGLIPRTLPSAYGLVAPSAPDQANKAAPSILLILILMACFMGMSNSIRELVKEREIYRRERGIGLSTVAYIGSKAAVLGMITAAQSAVLTVVGLAGMKMPKDGVLGGMPLLELMVATAAAAIASAMMGLVVSALVDNADKTLPPLVVFAMAQLVFMGSMMPLKGKAGLEQLSWLFPARWGYGAAASVIDLISVQRIGDQRLAPGIPVDPLWKHTAATYLADLAVVAVLGLVCLFVAARLLRRLDPQNAHGARRGKAHGRVRTRRRR